MPLPTLRRISVWALGLFFIAAGLNHFRAPDFYVRIMPPYLPWHRTLVLVSGACEILGGVGVLIARTRRWAGVGLIALLVAVFPANVQAALGYGLPFRLNLPTVLLWLRLPLQGVLVAWVWWTCLLGVGERGTGRKGDENMQAE